MGPKATVTAICVLWLILHLEVTVKRISNAPFFGTLNWPHNHMREPGSILYQSDFAGVEVSGSRFVDDGTDPDHYNPKQLPFRAHSKQAQRSL